MVPFPRKHKNKRRSAHPIPIPGCKTHVAKYKEFEDDMSDLTARLKAEPSDRKWSEEEQELLDDMRVYAAQIEWEIKLIFDEINQQNIKGS